MAWIGPQRWFFWLDQPPEQVARARKHLEKHGPMATFPRLKGASAVSPRSFERLAWYEDEAIIDIEGGGRPVLKTSPAPAEALSLDGLPHDVGEAIFQLAQVTSGIQPTRPPAPAAASSGGFDLAALWENSKGYLSGAGLTAVVGVIMFLHAIDVLGVSERTAITSRGRRNQSITQFIDWISHLLGPVGIVVIFGGAVVATLAWAIYKVVPRKDGTAAGTPPIHLLERSGAA